jgi:hypothetical protein
VRALTYDDADRVYDLLVRECGADPDGHPAFVRYVTDANKYGHEWRFCGSFGFGGKFYNANGGEWWVAYYPEDETEERRAVRDRVNAKLAEWSSALNRAAITRATPEGVSQDGEA